MVADPDDCFRLWTTGCENLDRPRVTTANGTIYSHGHSKPHRVSNSILFEKLESFKLVALAFRPLAKAKIDEHRLEPRADRRLAVDPLECDGAHLAGAHSVGQGAQGKRESTIAIA